MYSSSVSDDTAGTKNLRLATICNVIATGFPMYSYCFTIQFMESRDIWLASSYLESACHSLSLSCCWVRTLHAGGQFCCHLMFSAMVVDYKVSHFVYRVEANTNKTKKKSNNNQSKTRPSKSNTCITTLASTYFIYWCAFMLFWRHIRVFLVSHNGCSNQCARDTWTTYRLSFLIYNGYYTSGLLPLIPCLLAGVGQWPFMLEGVLLSPPDLCHRSRLGNILDTLGSISTDSLAK